MIKSITSNISRKVTTFTYLKDDMIVGICTLDFCNDNMPTLAGLFVDRNYRGLGIAKELMEACENELRLLGEPRIYLYVEIGNPVLELYTKQRYSIYASQHDYIFLSKNINQ